MKTKTGIQVVNGVPCFTAAPQLGQTDRAILLFPEAYGATGHMRDVACRFSRLGYKVYLFPLYFHQGQGADFMIAAPDKARREEMLSKLTTEDLTAEIIKLKSPLEHWHSSLTMIGFSIGGYASILASTLIKTDTLIAFYPNPSVNNFNYQLENVSQYLSSTPKNSLLLFGEADHSLPLSEVTLYQTLLTKAQVKVYPDSQHGFFCNSRHTYNKITAKAAWSDITEYLK